VNKINPFGFITGIIAWFLIMWYSSTQGECLQTKSCDGGDMIMFAVIGIGMLAPAWIIANIVSIIFGSEK